jgi:hypothetical protein
MTNTTEGLQPSLTNKASTDGSESPVENAEHDKFSNGSTNKDNDDEWASQISFNDIEVVDGKIVAIKGEEIKKVTVKKLLRLCVKKNITGYKNKSK